MARTTETNPRPVRLLVAAPNWLGDVVMTSPLLDILADARDAAGRPPDLVLSVRRRWSALFRGDPRVGEILPVERGGRHGGPVGVWRLARDWRRARCAGVVLGPPSLRVGLAARLGGLRRRVGFRTDGRGFLLNLGLPNAPRGAQHHAAELAQLGRVLLENTGLTPGERPSDRPILPGCEGVAPRATAGPPVWVFAPGATYGEAKVWPLRHAAAFVGEAVRHRNRRIVVLGDAEAAAAAAELAREADVSCRHEMEGGAAVVDLAGRTDLLEAVAVLKAAEGFVGNDSGLMHLAAALGVPTVGVFGSSNPDWTAPLGPWTETVAAAGFPCRPCYLRSCDQPVFCLDEIPSARVMSALTALLERRRAAER